MKALGLIEVRGMVPAVEALDSALKAANVNRLDVVKVGGGLVSVLIEGDVGAVRAAVDAAQAAAGETPIFDILPYQKKKVGIVTTGSEIKKGLIKDTFTPVLKEKLSEFPTEILGQVMPGDDKEQITEKILSFADRGADLIVCTGGMSVDPDDRTPGGIRDTGAKIVTYGAPVLPGAMLLVAYLKRNEKTIPVLGLPGCVMYAKRTVFDLILPRVMADDEIKAEEIAALGEGGLCLNCPVCTFPNCGFGK